MADYIIYTDAGGDVPRELCEKYGIRGVPMHYLVNGEDRVFQVDAPDKEEVCQELYDTLRHPVEVSTAQITPFVYEELFTPVLEEGHDILYCCFAQGLSATWQNALAAQETLRERFPERNVRFVSSMAAAAGLGIFTVQAAVNKEKGMDIEENARWLEEHALNCCHWFTVADLDFLKRGGRVSPAVAFLGGKLQIKPMLTIIADGTLKVFEKARGRKKSVDRLVELYQEYMDFGEAEKLVFINHAGCPDEAEELAQAVRAVSPQGVEVMVVGLSPIMGVHVGPDMVSLCHFGKKRDK